jgi:hypothetical protein
MKESVENGLRYSLGDGGLSVLARRFDLDAASTSPEKLHAMLTSLFNEIGGLVLERQIVRQLYERIGERFVELPGYSLESYVDNARETYTSQSRRPR